MLHQIQNATLVDWDVRYVQRVFQVVEWYYVGGAGQDTGWMETWLGYAVFYFSFPSILASSKGWEGEHSEIIIPNVYVMYTCAVSLLLPALG